MQNNLYLHTQYENLERIYLYPIWEVFLINSILTLLNSSSSMKLLFIPHFISSLKLMAYALFSLTNSAYLNLSEASKAKVQNSIELLYKP